MKAHVIGYAIAVVLLSTTAYSQATSPRSGTRAAAQPAVKEISAATKTYITKAMAADMYEVESSKLAVSNGRDPDVKQFAQQMIADHTKSSGKMSSTLQSLGITPQTSGLDRMHIQKLADLRTHQGPAFDKAYMNAQLEAHREALQIHQIYAVNGDVPALRTLATEMVSVISGHLTHAQNAASKAM